MKTILMLQNERNKKQFLCVLKKKSQTIIMQHILYEYSEWSQYARCWLQAAAEFGEIILSCSIKKCIIIIMCYNSMRYKGQSYWIVLEIIILIAAYVHAWGSPSAGFDYASDWFSVCDFTCAPISIAVVNIWSSWHAHLGTNDDILRHHLQLSARN